CFDRLFHDVEGQALASRHGNGLTFIDSRIAASRKPRATSNLLHLRRLADAVSAAHPDRREMSLAARTSTSGPASLQHWRLAPAKCVAASRGRSAAYGRDEHADGGNDHEQT